MEELEEVKEKYDLACQEALKIEAEMAEIYNKIENGSGDNSGLFALLGDKRKQLVSARSNVYELDRKLQSF